MRTTILSGHTRRTSADFTRQRFVRRLIDVDIEHGSPPDATSPDLAPLPRPSSVTVGP
jgi:hypothetical protein